MLKNEYLDAKIGVDTEENDPSKVLQFYFFIHPQDLIFTYVPRPSGFRSGVHMLRGGKSVRIIVEFAEDSLVFHPRKKCHLHGD